MDPEIKAKWVTALRSGNYQQGTGQLRISPAFARGPDRFCCLGVLCDLVEPDAWEPVYGALEHRHHEDIGQPDATLLSRLGLLDPCDEDARNPVETLVEMNDTDGATFDVIADWIEANL